MKLMQPLKMTFVHIERYPLYVYLICVNVFVYIIPFVLVYAYMKIKKNNFVTVGLQKVFIISFFILFCIFFFFLIAALTTHGNSQGQRLNWSYDLLCTLRQSQILNSLSEARAGTHILLDTSHVLNPLSHNKNSTFPYFLISFCIGVLLAN